MPTPGADPVIIKAPGLGPRALPDALAETAERLAQGRIADSHQILIGRRRGLRAVRAPPDRRARLVGRGGCGNRSLQDAQLGDRGVAEIAVDALDDLAGPELDVEAARAIDAQQKCRSLAPRRILLPVHGRRRPLEPFRP